jgi:hypothetical protein
VSLDARLNEIVEQRVIDSKRDYLDFTFLVDCIHALDLGPGHPPVRNDAVRMLMGKLLHRGFDVFEVDPMTRRFVPKGFRGDSPPVDQIMNEWNELGRKPDTGEISWFRLMPNRESDALNNAKATI